MRIVHIEVRNFRGIRVLDWSPSPGMNCLIGPGDSTKTTILDAIELALNPRVNYVGDDTDFYNRDFSASATVTVTIVDMPSDFSADNRYGLHLRGWDEVRQKVIDEPGEPATGVIDALSIRVEIDPSTLEGRWSIYNDRLRKEADPPSMRFKDANELATTRLGPYADRHLSWGRQSLLNRIGKGGKMNEQLAAATRAARDAFRLSNKDVFAVATERAETLGKRFGVQVRQAFTADLDIHGSSISAGGIALHDGDLPLRTLGTGSSRLLVSALQHDARGSQISLIDEIEHGLEPHRIARLLKYLLAVPPDRDSKATVPKGAAPQIVLTTHSEAVIRELRAEHIHAVRSEDGETTVRSVSRTAQKPDDAQRHLRTSPEAFLARRIVVGEGRTECGLLRGFDVCWTQSGRESFALRGIVAVDGCGVPQAVTLTQHLLDLGYECLALLDSDRPPSRESVAKAEAAGGIILEWPDKCSTDERIFHDVPWNVVQALVQYAAECHSADSVLAATNAECRVVRVTELTDLRLDESLDSAVMRTVLGRAAKSKGWFKNVERGEHVATLLYPCLDKMSDKPFAQYLRRVREWVDG